ncbi:MAG TPA: HAMP domain-containing sensor histidine kinase [Cyclobacteriaceae bacterium]|nr:HAMP domain-containing sensor histidine kinase [Cyclobacteriaceae bacterium]
MKIFGEFKKDVKRHQTDILKFIHKLEKEALKKGNTTLIGLLKKEKERIDRLLQALGEKSKSLYPIFQSELKKKTIRLEKKAETLSKAAEALTSDNFLLEYKKKDLLLLTTKLEEANDEILQKNKELMEKQELIAIQTETLNKAHQEILIKNHELETQKESLLDQSDYLHDANQTISFMHEKVERQNNEILRKNEELLSLNNEKNSLISIVAHDLKSPLNQIRSVLTLMKMGEHNSEEITSYINMIEGSAIRLSDMIGKILDVEAIESNNLNLKPQHVNLSATLNNITDRYALNARQKEIRIERNIQPHLFASVDPGYVDQVLENVISNAIKFSPTHKKLYVNLSHTGNKIIAEIKDEGPGLNEEDKKKLFVKYQKLSAKPTGDETSTGLGLSIVKKFVTAMNGEIWCESEPGNGASFFIAFEEIKSIVNSQ